MNDVEDSSTPDFQEPEIELQDINIATERPLNSQRNVPLVPTKTRSVSRPRSEIISRISSERSSFPRRGEYNDFRNSFVTTPKSVGPAYNCGCLWVFYLVFLVIEGIFVFLIGYYFKLPDFSTNFNDFDKNHQYYQIVTVVIFLGLGLLHSSLQFYSWTSMISGIFLGVFALEIGIVYVAFWENVFYYNFIDRLLTFKHLIKSAFNALTSMITLGAVLGKLTMPQYIILFLFEGFFSSFNYGLCIQLLKAHDDGGCIHVYLFGACFGIAVSFVILLDKDYDSINSLTQSETGMNYKSATFGIIGTIIIWAFMPFVNAALTPLATELPPDSINDFWPFRYRAIMNTYLALIGSSFGSMLFSFYFNNRLSINNIMFSSLSGAVGVSAFASFLNYGFISISIGLLFGVLTGFLLMIFRPNLKSRFCLDTIGVLVLYLIPAFIGEITEIIIIGAFKNDEYNGKGKVYLLLKARSQSKQALINFACIFITIGISLVLGAFTGLLLYIFPLGTLNKYYADSENFEPETEPFAENLKIRQLKSKTSLIKLNNSF